MIPWTTAPQAPLSKVFPRQELLEWVAISFSRESSRLLDLAHISCIGRQILYHFGKPQNAYCCCSVTQSCLTLCDPMECSTPGFLVHHQLPELAHTHVHQVDGAIQPSHSLSFPSLDFNLSQNQGLF